MKMFVRFRELEGKLLFARIGPDANVLEFVMPHFADRFPLENFVIVDVRRGLAGIHETQKDWFLVRLDGEERERFSSMALHYSEEETEMAELFRHFCVSLGIKERKNLGLQQQFLPLKYRRFMTEFDPAAQHAR